MVSCLRRVSHMTRGQKARRPSFYAARSVNLGRNDSRPLSPHPTFGTTALLLLLHLHFHSSTLFFFFTCCTSAPIADFVLFTTRPAWLVSNVRHRMKGGHQKNPVRFWLKKRKKNCTKKKRNFIVCCCWRRALVRPDTCIWGPAESTPV